MMTQVVFEQEAGPNIIEEQEITKVREVGRDKATKSAKPMPGVQSSPKKVVPKTNLNGKSKKRVPQTGMGPGQYNPDAATK